MDVRRLRPGEWLSLAGGVALIVSLFSTWYTLSAGALTASASGWQAFTVIDVLLALVAAGGIALAVVQAVETRPALPVAASVLLVPVGFIGVLLVVFRLIVQPGPNELVDLGAGAWLGLAATLAISAGAWLAVGDERMRHVPPGPEPELRKLAA
jgi:hypothetical protein